MTNKIERKSFVNCYLKKGKVVYGQEPPNGESTTTECGFNYQLLAVITEVAKWGAPSCSQPQPATDNGIRDGRSNWLVAPPTLHRAVPPELHVLHTANHKTCCTESATSVRLQNARPMHGQCGHSGYFSYSYRLKKKYPFICILLKSIKNSFNWKTQQPILELENIEFKTTIVTNYSS